MRNIKISGKHLSHKNFNVEEDITLEKISTAIRKSKNNKVPGLDGFTAEIAKALWRKDK